MVDAAQQENKAIEAAGEQAAAASSRPLVRSPLRGEISRRGVLGLGWTAFYVALGALVIRMWHAGFRRYESAMG